MRTPALLIALCLTVLASVPAMLRADDPPATTTKPTTKPLPPLDARNSVEASLPGKPAAWRVFKGWKEQKLSGDVARSWVVPPLPKDANTPISTFTVSVIGGGKPDATIEDAADLNKQALRQRDPNVKFVRDEPIDVAGNAGWVLVYDTTQTGTLRDDKGSERRVKSPVRSQRVLSLRGEHSATLTFTCGPDDFERFLRNVDRVYASFAWKD